MIASVIIAIILIVSSLRIHVCQMRSYQKLLINSNTLYSELIAYQGENYQLQVSNMELAKQIVALEKHIDTVDAQLDAYNHGRKN